MTAELVGLSFSWEATEACYVPIPAEQTEAQLIIDEFKTLFANELIGKTGQNIKYDMNVLKNYGVAINGILLIR